MATLRLFATVRVAAGTGRATIAGDTVADVLANATEQYGTGFAELLPVCRVWVNGEAAEPGTAVGDADEVALLPPVSGG
ncbi:MAG: MoaD/ThiS family protein [Acidimicrobiales bacterium]